MLTEKKKERDSGFQMTLKHHAKPLFPFLWLFFAQILLLWSQEVKICRI